jgi:hypothetical protein
VTRRLACVAAPALAAGGPPSLAHKCGSTEGVTANPFRLSTDDRAHLYAFEAGSGPVAVVLAHESPAGQPARPLLVRMARGSAERREAVAYGLVLGSARIVPTVSDAWDSGTTSFNSSTISSRESVSF